MSDDLGRSPSPPRRSTRDRRQTIIEGTGIWEDPEGAEGRNTPDLDASRDDPDPGVQGSNLAGVVPRAPDPTEHTFLCLTMDFYKA